MEYIYIISNGELRHHGVKGQRWGVRRYQNADGSLTPAGRKRAEKALKKKKDHHNKEDPVKSMSDEQLDKSISRLQKEAQYKQLTQTKAEKGRKIVEKMLTDIVVPAATTSGRAYAQKLMTRGLNAIDKKASGMLQKALKKSGKDKIPGNKK